VKKPAVKKNAPIKKQKEPVKAEKKVVAKESKAKSDKVHLIHPKPICSPEKVLVVLSV
jgi:hypothetical protein